MKLKLPCWLITAIVMIALTVISVVIYGIVYSVTFEEETREIDKEQDNDKDEDEDETIDLHIRRHKIEKEHERKMEEAKMHHELYRTGIIGPCSVIAIGIICTLIYFIIIKPGKTDPTNQTRNLKTTLAKTKLENEDETENAVRIPKAKVHLFENMVMMGYEKSKIAKSIKHCNNISEAIEVMSKLDAEAQDKNDESTVKPTQQAQSSGAKDDGMITIWL